MGYRHLIISLVLLVLSAGAAVWLLLSGLYWGAGGAVLCVLFLVYRVISIYTGNLRKLNYLLGAFENGDLAFHFAENSTFLQDRVFNILLNKVRDFVSEQRSMRGANEAFHTAVESLSRTGILGVLPAGEVRCSNRAVRAMLGMPEIRHVSDVDKVLPGLSLRLKAVEDGGVLEIPVGSEQRVYNALIECRTVMDGQTPVRIYVFEEKTDDAAEARSQENAQWQKMTRIISHEVLNTITPIVSLSDTLLGMTGERSVREGIEVIGESARGLLGFVNGYRALSRVPVPQIHPFRFRAMLDYVLQPLMPDVEALGGRVDISLEDEGMVLFADEQLSSRMPSMPCATASGTAPPPVTCLLSVSLRLSMPPTIPRSIFPTTAGPFPMPTRNIYSTRSSLPVPRVPASAWPCRARSCVPTQALSALTAPTPPSPPSSSPSSPASSVNAHFHNFFNDYPQRCPL